MARRTASSAHLLIDVTGNTHRAEFCIDKLYSPDSDAAAGRAWSSCAPSRCRRTRRMSLVQQLLLRALDRRVLEDAVRPDARALGHGAARPLHAAAFRRQDFHDVLAELRRAGFPLEAAWFAPHFEFRFPARRRGQPARRPPRAAPGARAVARARRGGRRRRHGALRRLLGRAAAGAGHRHDDERHVVPATAGACRSIRRGTTASSWPACAIALAAARRPAPDHPRARAAGVRPRRRLDRAARSAAAPTMWPIPAGATSRRARSTPTRPRAGGWPASSRSATRRVAWRRRRKRATRTSR